MLFQGAKRSAAGSPNRFQSRITSWPCKGITLDAALTGKAASLALQLFLHGPFQTVVDVSAISLWGMGGGLDIV